MIFAKEDSESSKKLEMGLSVTFTKVNQSLAKLSSVLKLKTGELLAAKIVSVRCYLIFCIGKSKKIAWFYDALLGIKNAS